MLPYKGIPNKLLNLTKQKQNKALWSKVNKQKRTETDTFDSPFKLTWNL
jgi:hypothetical protein